MSIQESALNYFTKPLEFQRTPDGYLKRVLADGLQDEDAVRALGISPEKAEEIGAYFGVQTQRQAAALSAQKQILVAEEWKRTSR